jgi:hypothetical protein
MPVQLSDLRTKLDLFADLSKRAVTHSLPVPVDTKLSKPSNDGSTNSLSFPLHHPNELEHLFDESPDVQNEVPGVIPNFGSASNIITQVSDRLITIYKVHTKPKQLIFQAFQFLHRFN